MSATSEMFSTLLNVAAQSYLDGGDALEREPSYLELLQFIKSHPEDDSLFRQRFIEMVRAPKEEYVPLIQYCMQELQWQEVDVVAQQVADATEQSLVRRWMELIRRSFTNEWPGLDVYDYYLSKR
jgi:hypothetical protein